MRTPVYTVTIKNSLSQVSAYMYVRVPNVCFTFVFTGGFYSQKVASNPGLRIISLNTNLYYGPNIMTLNKTDPANQFEWLENTLNSSLWNKEKVDPIE
jgi:hypothetical protein